MKLSSISDFVGQNSSIMKPIAYIFTFVFLNLMLPALLNVFRVKQKDYMNYVLFMDAMLIFYIILPKKITIF